MDLYRLEKDFIHDNTASKSEAQERIWDSYLTKLNEIREAYEKISIYLITIRTIHISDVACYCNYVNTSII